MFRLGLLSLVLLALAPPAAAVAGSNGSDHATMCVSTTQLRAENETDASTSAATGVTQIKVRNDGTIEFRTHILNPDNETFVAGHIHLAPVGVPGGIVLPLFGTTTDATHIVHSGETSNPVLGAEICADPTAYYVNYHTTEFMPGAIRGQLG